MSFCASWELFVLQQVLFVQILYLAMSLSNQRTTLDFYHVSYYSDIFKQIAYPGNLCCFPGACYSTEGCRELGGGPGPIFFWAPISKLFPEKKIFGQQQPPPPSTTFWGKKFSGCVRYNHFTSIFHTKFRYFAPKKQISCPLSRNISPKK